MCVSTDSAAQLPDGIWQCSADAVMVVEEEEEERMFTYVYPHLENVSHSLRSASVDANFCDPQSPRSLSGYMDISGSQYDKNRDKHYFYWFFEKRQEAGEEVKEKSDVPLIVWLTGGPGCSSTLVRVVIYYGSSVESLCCTEIGIFSINFQRNNYFCGLIFEMDSTFSVIF